MKKRGQGAMEHLMTYGWAILAVVIVGVVLWQMGVFNPSGGIVKTSSGFSEVRPLDWACDSASQTMWVTFMNGAGERIVNASIVGAAGACPSNTTISAGDTITCTDIPADCGNAGDAMAVDVSIEYEKVLTGGSHISSGQVRGAAE